MQRGLRIGAAQTPFCPDWRRAPDGMIVDGRLISGERNHMGSKWVNVIGKQTNQKWARCK